MVTTTPVTIEQAAAILGVSATTIRRRIRAGTLQVTETRRPQGVVWLVHLPPGTMSTADVTTADTATVTTTPSTPAAPADAIATMIQATLTPIFAPLVAELAASRQANGALTDQLLNQAETIGELRAENAALRATQAALDASTAAESVETTPEPAWHTLHVYGVTAVVLVTLVLVATLVLR